MISKVSCYNCPSPDGNGNPFLRGTKQKRLECTAGNSSQKIKIYQKNLSDNHAFSIFDLRLLTIHFIYFRLQRFATLLTNPRLKSHN